MSGDEARARLRRELASASRNADGFHPLDTTGYPELTTDQLLRAARDVGWELAGGGGAGGTLRLVPRGGTASRPGEGPFAGNSVPDELRADPVVRQRAAEITRTRGLDPLAAETLDHARRRHQHWATLFRRQVRLAFLYGFVGAFMLAGSIASVESDGFPMLVVVSLVVFALFGVSMLKAVRARRGLRADIGAVVDAYEELRALAERAR